MDTLVIDPPTTRLTLLQPSPTNPRTLTMTPASIARLAETIAEHGVMHAILARPRPGALHGEVPLEIVAGERRWRACCLLAEQGRNPHDDGIPCMVLALSDAQVLAMQLIENVHREDLHPLEEAEHYHRMMQEPGAPRTVQQIAAAGKVDEQRVQDRLVLLRLVPPAREHFLAGRLFLTTAMQVARMPPAVQAEIAQHLSSWGGEPMGPKAAAAFIRERFMLRLAQAPFDPADTALVPEAGACTDCPKRTGASPQLFADIAEEDTCTDTACFNGKKAAQRERLVQELATSGFTLLRGDAARDVCSADGRSLKAGWHLLEAAVPPGLGDPALKVHEVLTRGQQPNSLTRVVDHPSNPVLVYAVTTADLEVALRKIKAHREQLDKAAAKKKAKEAPPPPPAADETKTGGGEAAWPHPGTTTASGETNKPASETQAQANFPTDEDIEELLAFKPPATVAGRYGGLTLKDYTEEREMRARAILTAGRVARAVNNDRGEGLPDHCMGKMIVQLCIFGDGYLGLADAAELCEVGYPVSMKSLDEQIEWLWGLDDEQANRLALVMLTVQEDRPFAPFKYAVAQGLNVGIDDVEELARANVAGHLQLGAIQTGSKAAAGKKKGGEA